MQLNNNFEGKLIKKTNAQFAIEFIVLIAFMFLVFLGFIAVITTKILESKENERQGIVEDIAALVKNEIELAKSTTDGYTRNFKLPGKIEGNTYSVEIIDNRELVVDYVDKEYVLFLQENIRGNVSLGSNTIRKEKGTIYINIPKTQT